MSMLDYAAVRAVIAHWILNELTTFQNGIDWVALRAAVAAKIVQLVPYEMLDKPLDVLLDEVIDGVRSACADAADEALLVNDALAGDWKKAMADLKALLAKVVNPTPVQTDLMKAL